MAAERSFLVFSGGNDRAVIGFLRALWMCGERAHIVARTTDDGILRTRFRHDVKWVRQNHALSLDIFAECVTQVRNRGASGILVVLPSTEYFNTFLLDNRDSIESMGCAIPLVDAKLYSTLTEKYASTLFFSRAGIASPAEVDPLAPGNLPAIAKPKRNISESGESLYPIALNTVTAVSEFLASQPQDQYFFQQHISGESHYLLFYFTQNGSVFAWSQRNLLQQPGGKSMLLANESDFHQSTTAKLIIEALKEFNFHGLGMVEIIRGHGVDFFIEMNPRIWGPVQLCIDSNQPLVHAFIGQSLQDDASHYLSRLSRRGRSRYFWFGGLLSTLATGGKPTWHCQRRNLVSVILFNLRFDLYLRRDSWRIFVTEVAKTISRLWNHG